MIDLASYRNKLARLETLKLVGKVRQAGGLVIESKGPPAGVGELCEIRSQQGGSPIMAEVIGFRDKTVLSMPVYEIGGVKLGDPIIARKQLPSVEIGDALLGRVIDGNGRPIDGKGMMAPGRSYPLHRQAPSPLDRCPIDTPLGTGVRAIDGLLSVGRGQRVGIFGGSGVGKSTLLGMMARHTEAAVSVIALVGERGREVKAFIERDLGEEGLKHSVVVVSTSDHPPLMRIRAALTATAVAECFRDQGKDVLLVMDSVTRVAMAQREIGLAAGEPPSSKGYTPSVFTLLPRIFERAGNMEKGSITGFYTVLVEGDDMNEPVADAVRGLLDGHIVLSRELAWKNHFPAISALESVSRLMSDISKPEQHEMAGKVRELLATYRKAEDMINIGAYARGSNPKIDQAIDRIDHIHLYLQQKSDEKVPRETAIQELMRLVKK